MDGELSEQIKSSQETLRHAYMVKDHAEQMMRKLGISFGPDYHLTEGYIKRVAKRRKSVEAATALESQRRTRAPGRGVRAGRSFMMAVHGASGVATVYPSP